MSSGLPPEQRPNPMMAWVQAVQSTDKDTLERVFTPMAAAGTKIWNRMPAEQRDGMMRDSMQVMQRFGSGQPKPSGGRRPDPAAPANYKPQLDAIARKLGVEYDAMVVVEPSLILFAAPARPATPAANTRPADLQSTLDSLTSEIHALEWRRVYLPAGTVLTRGFTDKLAMEVRRVDALKDAGLTVMPQANTPGRTLEQFNNFGDSVGAARSLSSAGLGARPIYLIFRRLGDEEGALSARYASLLKRQMEMLLSMNADQLGEVLDQAIQTYQSADGSAKMDVMGLPSMAAMMAIWFPRAAKERAGRQ